MDHGHRPEGRRGGRPDPAALKCIVSAPSHISDDLADAREQVRWFPAMVSNHVKDLIDRYGTDGSVVPEGPHGLCRGAEVLRLQRALAASARSTASSSRDEICDRFCVLGTAEQAIAKLRELEAIGVDQFNIYLMTHGQEQTLEAYGRDILPEFSGVAA